MRRRIWGVVAAGIALLALWFTRREAHEQPRELARMQQVNPSITPEPSAMPASVPRLEGRVIDEQDRPVAAARIAIGERRTTSDADGNFAFDIPFGRYRLAGDAGELYVMTAAVKFDATSPPVVLRAVRGPMFVVTVRGDGRPLANAEVRIDDDVAITNAEGIARIGGRAPDTYDVTARAPSFAPQSRLARLEPGNADSRIDFDLAHGAPLAGIVVDEQGKRVPAAKVDVTLLAEGHESIEAVADASGVWTVDAVAEGRYHVSAKADGFGPTVGTPIALDGMTRRDGIIVRVTAGGTLFGKVVDPTGQPVAGITVEAQQEARVDQFTATSDAQGRYEIRGLPEGSYLVIRFTGRIGHIAHHATIVSGQRTEQDLVVDDEHVDGVVVDPKGTPVAGVWVFGDDDTDVTDARGRFELLYRKGGKHTLRADRQRNPLQRTESIEVEGNAHDVRVVLADGGTLTGRVMLDGKPVTDFAIAIAPANDGDLIALDGSSLHVPDGRFALHDLPAGSWRVVVAAPGCDVAFTSVTTVEPNRSRDVGDIVLARGRRITGHVTDARGAPVGGARATLNEAPAPWHTTMSLRFDVAAETVTDASGAFVFEGISRRTRWPRLSVTAEHPQLGLSSKVDVENDRADLVLAAAGAIDGVVENFAGDQTFFVAQSESWTSQSTEVNRAGEFHFENVPPGRYTIRESMDSTHRRIRPAPVTVEANRRARVRVMLDMATVAVRIQIASACHEVVKLTPLDETSSGAAGEVSCTKPSTLPFVAPGAYRACDWDRRCATIHVTRSPSPQTIELRLEAPP